MDLVNNDFESLLKHLNEFDINEFDNNGSNLLHYYVQNITNFKIPVSKVINELIDRGIDINAKQTKINKRTALHIAIFVQSKEAFDILIENNILIDNQDKNGNSPLWLAVMNYDESSDISGYFIETLLKRGADPKLKNFHDVSPESLAYEIANLDEIKTKYFRR